MIEMKGINTVLVERPARFLRREWTPGLPDVKDMRILVDEHAMK